MAYTVNHVLTGLNTRRLPTAINNIIVYMSNVTHFATPAESDGGRVV